MGCDGCESFRSFTISALYACQTVYQKNHYKTIKNASTIIIYIRYVKHCYQDRDYLLTPRDLVRYSIFSFKTFISSKLNVVSRAPIPCFSTLACKGKNNRNTCTDTCQRFIKVRNSAMTFLSGSSAVFYIQGLANKIPNESLAPHHRLAMQSLEYRMHSAYM